MFDKREKYKRWLNFRGIVIERKTVTSRCHGNIIWISTNRTHKYGRKKNKHKNIHAWLFSAWLHRTKAVAQAVAHTFISSFDIEDRLFCPTHANRNWTFCTLRPWFWVSPLFRVKTLGSTNLIVSRHIRRGKGSFLVDLLKNVAAFTALFKNTRTLSFKDFCVFRCRQSSCGPLRKQWSVIGGFRLACVQIPRVSINCFREPGDDL